MKIVGRYSFNEGEGYIEENYPHLLREVEEVIQGINAEKCRLKKPKDAEIKRAQRVGVSHFYSPKHLNSVFDWQFLVRGWDVKPRIKTNDPTRNGFREMDFIKEKLGVEVQMGKYAFLTYDIVAKMPIFKKFGLIDCGIEICPMASMLPHMSSGIGCYEQVKWDLTQRGKTGKDIPVLVLGFEAKYFHDKGSNKIQEGQGSYLDEEILEPVIYQDRYSNKKFAKGTYKLLGEAGIQISNEEQKKYFKQK